MGSGTVIRPGEIQIMTAGTGVEYSESNHSKTDLLHFLQIWIIPEKRDLALRYQQKIIHKAHDQLILIGARDEQDSVVTINQDVNLYTAFLTKNHSIDYSL